jgi:hypothetical protein
MHQLVGEISKSRAPPVAGLDARSRLLVQLDINQMGQGDEGGREHAARALVDHVACGGGVRAWELHCEVILLEEMRGVQRQEREQKRGVAFVMKENAGFGQSPARQRERAYRGAKTSVKAPALRRGPAARRRLHFRCDLLRPLVRCGACAAHATVPPRARMRSDVKCVKHGARAQMPGGPISFPADVVMACKCRRRRLKASAVGMARTVEVEGG